MFLPYIENLILSLLLNKIILLQNTKSSHIMYLILHGPEDEVIYLRQITQVVLTCAVELNI